MVGKFREKPPQVIDLEVTHCLRGRSEKGQLPPDKYDQLVEKIDVLHQVRGHDDRLSLLGEFLEENHHL